MMAFIKDRLISCWVFVVKLAMMKKQTNGQLRRRFIIIRERLVGGFVCLTPIESVRFVVNTILWLMSQPRLAVNILAGDSRRRHVTLGKRQIDSISSPIGFLLQFHFIPFSFPSRWAKFSCGLEFHQNSQITAVHHYHWWYTFYCAIKVPRSLIRRPNSRVFQTRWSVVVMRVKMPFELGVNIYLSLRFEIGLR